MCVCVEHLFAKVTCTCAGECHLHPTTLNEAVDASGKQDLISLVYLQTKWSAWVLESTACCQSFAVGFTCQTSTVMSVIAC